MKCRVYRPTSKVVLLDETPMESASQGETSKNLENTMRERVSFETFKQIDNAACEIKYIRDRFFLQRGESVFLPNLK